jgi:hypothetical protein
MNAESWRHTDTPLYVITVLYRYNTVRNDFVDLKIMIKNIKTETATGSILRTRRRTCESSFNERQATHTALTFVYGDRPSDVIKTHVKENKLSTDVLLKESINAIVRDMMKTAKIKHPEHTAD